MKIFLCGYMGSGKTTIAQLLAQKLEIPFYDLDEEIIKNEGTITDIFRKKGEVFFRKKENEKLKTFLEEEKDFVLALGGGTPCYGNNLELIKKASGVKMVYLKLSAENITNRLQTEKEQRPIISHLQTKEELLEFVRKHLFERNFYYNQSDITISIDHRSPKEGVHLILEKLN